MIIKLIRHGESLLITGEGGIVLIFRVLINFRKFKKAL